MSDDRSRRPGVNWGCIVIIIALFALGPFCAALGEKRPVGAFAEILLAEILVIASPLACFFLAYVAKELIEEITDRAWLGRIVGIILFLVLMLGAVWVMGKIPGVNWRIDKILERRGDEP